MELDRDVTANHEGGVLPQHMPQGVHILRGGVLHASKVVGVMDGGLVGLRNLALDPPAALVHLQAALLFAFFRRRPLAIIEPKRCDGRAARGDQACQQPWIGQDHLHLP